MPKILSYVVFLLLPISCFAGSFTIKDLKAGITVTAGETITVTNANYKYIEKNGWASDDYSLIVGIGDPKQGGDLSDGRRSCIFTQPKSSSQVTFDDPANSQSFSIKAPATAGTYDIWVGLATGKKCSDADWYTTLTPWSGTGSTPIYRTQRAKLGTAVVNAAPPPPPPAITCPEGCYGNTCYPDTADPPDHVSISPFASIGESAVRKLHLGDGSIPFGWYYTFSTNYTLMNIPNSPYSSDPTKGHGWCKPGSVTRAYGTASCVFGNLQPDTGLPALDVCVPGTVFYMSDGSIVVITE